jgi:hypothetical protein
MQQLQLLWIPHLGRKVSGADRPIAGVAERRSDSQSSVFFFPFHQLNQILFFFFENLSQP